MSAAEPHIEKYYPVEPLEWCDKQGAQALKEKIEAYWRERGCTVNVDLQVAGFHPIMRSARIDVRSDLLNGWPRVRPIPLPLPLPLPRPEQR